MKKELAVLTALGTMLAFSGSAMAAEGTNIFYDGKLLTTKEPVIVQNDRTLLALRDYFEALNIKVDWNEQTGIATVDYPEKKLLLEPATGSVYLNNIKQKVDVGPQLIDDKTYVPVRFLSEIFDCTVDYTANNDNSATVTINSRKAPANLVHQEGDVTIVTRLTTPVDTANGNAEAADYQNWVDNNTAYLINDDGNPVEIASLGKTVEVHTINLKTATVKTDSFETGKQNNFISGIEKVSGGFKVLMNQSTSDYLGVGKPLNTTILDTIDTKGGNFDVYYGDDTYDTITLSAKDGSITEKSSLTKEGLTLDISNAFGGADSASYARTPGHTSAFMINETLLLLNKSGDEVFSGSFADQLEESKIVAMDGKFLILSTAKSGSGVNTLYTTMYDTDGTQISPYFKRYTFDDQRGLTIKDTAVDGNQVYMILRTNWDNYLGTYDVKEDVFTIKTLSSPINRLIPTSSGYKAFGADNDHYYWQDVQ